MVLDSSQTEGRTLDLQVEYQGALCGPGTRRGGNGRLCREDSRRFLGSAYYPSRYSDCFEAAIFPLKRATSRLFSFVSIETPGDSYRMSDVGA
jgi:hypothetical protein